MAQSVQYLTNEQGEKVGVFLSLQTYTQLTQPETQDENLLLNLSVAELEALADCKLAVTEQAYLDELLTSNTKTGLTAEQESALDHLLDKVDQLTLLKTRARYTLNWMRGDATAA